MSLIALFWFLMKNYSIKWRRKYEFNNSDPNRSIEAELSRLRKECSELRQERDILKKSVAIFIKPQK